MSSPPFIRKSEEILIKKFQAEFKVAFSMEKGKTKEILQVMNFINESSEFNLSKEILFAKVEEEECEQLRKQYVLELLMAIMNFNFEKSVLNLTQDQRKALHMKYFQLYQNRKQYAEH